MNVNEIIEKVRNAVNEGKKVKMILENSGVYTSGIGNYKLFSRLSIYIDDEMIYDEGESIKYGGPMWASNYTGSNVEKLYLYLKDAFMDYIYDKSETHNVGYHTFTVILRKKV